MVANGYVPASDLVYVQSGIQLSRATANAWFAMAAAASATGNRIGIATPAGGYRPYDVQKDMREHPLKYGLSSSSTVPIAPAGASSHGYGTRVDVVGAVWWVVANGRRFGFWREFGAADPNHFAHDGVTATAGNTSSPVEEEAEPINNHEEETGMFVVKIKDGRGWLGVANELHYYLAGERFIETSTMNEHATVEFNNRRLDGSGSWIDVPNLDYIDLYVLARAAGNVSVEGLTVLRVAAEKWSAESKKKIPAF